MFKFLTRLKPLRDLSTVHSWAWALGREGKREREGGREEREGERIETQSDSLSNRDSPTSGSYTSQRVVETGRYCRERCGYPIEMGVACKMGVVKHIIRINKFHNKHTTHNVTNGRGT